MGSIIDDRGYNQGFKLVMSTEVRMKRRADWMRQEMDAVYGKNVLEIGCGTGEISYWIANSSTLKVTGTDLCVPFIEQANKSYQSSNLKYEVLDFNLPAKPESEKFDYIIGNGILHHLYHHLDVALQNIRNILKPDGKIIFIEPNIYNPYCAVIFHMARNWANLEPDEMAFSKPFITRKLRHNHFKNIHVEYKDFLLPGIPKIMIQPSIFIGNMAEKTPLLKMLSQSIFITAQL